MGTISVNKLGGLALIIGPIVTVICYFIQPGGAIIDAADPADAIASITAMISNSGLTQLTGIVIPLGLIVFLFGIYTLQAQIRSGGSGDALSRLGALLLTLGVVGWVIGSGLSTAIGGLDLATQAQAVGGPLYAASSGIGTIAAITAGLGFLTFGLAVSTRDDQNKIAALVAALAGAVVGIAAVVGGLDSTQLELMTTVSGICFIVLTVWGVLLGLKLRNE